MPNTQSLDSSFDIYDLYNTNARINSLETLLCCLVKQEKPIDNCIIALDYLESKQVTKSKKPKQSVMQFIAEAAYNAFAIIGAFVILSCLYKAPNAYYSYENTSSEQGVIRQLK